MGMGLSGFLGSNPGGGGGKRGSFLNWKDKGSVVIWLHTASDIFYAYNHQFMVEDEYEDRDTHKMKQVLRFPRFVSPDPIEVLEKQYFRDRSTDRLELMPDRDPFLLLREWIRVQVRAGALAPETVIFEWFDPKNNQVVQWRAGDLSGLEKRGKLQWNHTLDAKLQYVMLVVDDAKPSEGVQIAQETKGLGDKLREEIKRQMESKGDVEGDPTREPYAFKWTFDKASKNPNDMYGCYRYDKAVYTEEIYKLIAETEAQDVSRLIRPQDGDAEKIRAAFEQAQRIDLPIEYIFSTEFGDRRAVAEGRVGSPSSVGARRGDDFRGTRPGGSPSVPSTPGGVRRPGASGPAAGAQDRQQAPAPTGARSPAPGAATGARAPAPASTGAASPGPQTRRRKVEDPKPPPPPAEDTIPCDDCGHPMLPTDAKCANCGATYTVEEDAAAPPPKSTSATGVRRPPSAADRSQQAEVDRDAQGPGLAGEPCWSCGSRDINLTTGNCNGCGMTQNVDDGGDDIPF